MTIFAQEGCGVIAADDWLPAYDAVLRRDPCSYCDQDTEAVDHIEPVSRGGENARVLCSRARSARRCAADSCGR